MCILDQGATS
ncbi:unnamed protein product [Linum tenue]|uniref:Uncharacterized protein n=1 Tax=Linum tenue TaxID=586396 RepID=A0AAV0IJL7_9ROSI|nr:unnamed protein product [Linum tenue]